MLDVKYFLFWYIVHCYLPDIHYIKYTCNNPTLFPANSLIIHVLSKHKHYYVCITEKDIVQGEIIIALYTCYRSKWPPNHHLCWKLLTLENTTFTFDFIKSKVVVSYCKWLFLKPYDYLIRSENIFRFLLILRSLLIFFI